MHALLTLAADPVEHVVDKPLLKAGAGGLGPFISQDPQGRLWLVSNVTVMLVLSAIVTALIVIPPARRAARARLSGKSEDLAARGWWANLVEGICVFLRDDVFKPVLAEQTDRFAPILWTFFWFILVCNLMGMIPIADLTGLFGINHGHGIGGTATQSIWVTGALACTAFLFYNVTAIIKDWKGYLMHLTGGAPWFMWPVMFIVEIIGTAVKPFALAIRLFANMTGGHLVIAVMLSFVGPLWSFTGAGKSLAILPVLGAVAINMLELLVAVIQAYIFTFLTCLFLGLLVVHEHEHGDDAHEDEHGDTPGVHPDQIYDAHEVHQDKSKYAMAPK